MDGVASRLPAAAAEPVRAVWAELETEFGWRGVFVTPFPHFSYHVAQAYDGPRAAAALEAAAGRLAPFTITTAGLGVFTGPAPVLYVPIVRTAALSAVQAQIWAALEPLSTGAEPYYRPEQWLPHITLGIGDVTAEALGQALARLGPRRFQWTIPIREVSLLAAGGPGPALERHWPLGR